MGPMVTKHLTDPISMTTGPTIGQAVGPACIRHFRDYCYDDEHIINDLPVTHVYVITAKRGSFFGITMLEIIFLKI